MGAMLFVISIFYCIYLTFRLRELQDEIYESSLDVDELEIKVYNKMMEIRREIKDSIKIKKVAKSRGGSSKRSRRVPKA